VLRTSVDDDLFIRMDTALGVPVVNQMVWRLRERPTDDELERFAAALGRGRLARLLRRSPVPLIRDHWVHGGADTGSVRIETAPIAPDAVVAWMDDAASRPFDLVRGPVWELRAAPLEGTGSMVSLCLSHAVGDGLAALSALADALDGDSRAAFTAPPPTPLDQAREMVGRSATIVGSVGAIVADRIRRGAGPARSPGDVVTASTSSTRPVTIDAGPTAPTDTERVLRDATSAVATALPLAAVDRTTVYSRFGHLLRKPRHDVFMVSYLDYRRFPLLPSLHARHISSDGRADDLQLWFWRDDYGISVRARFPDTATAAPLVTSVVDDLVARARAAVPTASDATPASV
jgi:hypothetical protein